MADVVIPIGGLGTQVGTTTIAGCVEKTAWDAGSPSDFMLTDGEALVSGAGIQQDVTGVVGTLTDVGAFAGLTTLVDMYVFINGSSGSTPDGYYIILSRPDDDTITFTTTSLTAGVALDNETVSYIIGGAGDIRANTGGSLDLQDVLDAIGANVADGTNNADILWNRDCTIDTTVDIDIMTGSATTRVRVIGTNADFIDDGVLNVVLNDATGIAGGLIEFIGSPIAITFKNIDFDAATNATYAVDAGIDTLQGIVFQNCRMQRATSHGVLIGGNAANEYIGIVSCEVDSNIGGGIVSWNLGRGVVQVDGSNIHDNGVDGIKSGIGLACTGTLICSNGGKGIYANGSIDRRQINDNTIYNNGGDGVYLNATSGSLGFVFNNTSSNNGGYGYNLNGMGPGILNFFGSNHSYNNVTAHTDIVADAGFAALFNGGNLGNAADDVDPLFTSAGTGNFTPTSSSPLIDAGVGGTGDTIGALCATAGGGAGTTGISKSRAFGGI